MRLLSGAVGLVLLINLGVAQKSPKTSSVDGTLSGKFEIAPPGRSEAFKKYLEWIARKK